MTLSLFHYILIVLIFPLEYFTINLIDLSYSLISLLLIDIFNGTLP